MKQRIFILTLVLAFVGTLTILNAQTAEDFEMKVLPGATETTSPADVDLSVTLTTKIDGTQGWSFGVILDADEGVTAAITEVSIAEGVMQINNGNPADFKTTSWFTADDLAHPGGACDPTCSDLNAAAVTQGVVISFTQAASLVTSTDFGLVDLKVHAEADLGADETKEVRVDFTDDVGTPPVATVAVHSGASIAPAVLEGAVITLIPKPPCSEPAAFTIEVQGGEGDTNEEMTKLIILNFNADGTNDGAAIQGWSYGVCVKDPAKLQVLDAVSEGTDTATVKNGAPADFDTPTVYDNGVTHGIVIDFMASVTLEATNNWSGLAVTYKILMDQEGDSVFVTACDKALGEPPVANVMVIGGASIPGSDFEGTDPEAEEGGCCDPTACNKPGEFKFVPPPPGNFFYPGSANGDGRLDIADGIYILNALFRGGPPLPCEKAADANNDCVVDASDAIYIINYQFLDGPAPVLGTGCTLVETDVCPELTCEVNECEGEAP